MTKERSMIFMEMELERRNDAAMEKRLDQYQALAQKRENQRKEVRDDAGRKKVRR